MLSEKMKIIDNKIVQNKAQYNLDRQTATISALSLVNVGKYVFLTGKDVLPQTKLVRENCKQSKDLNIHPLDSELKKKITMQKIVSKIRQGL